MSRHSASQLSSARAMGVLAFLCLSLWASSAHAQSFFGTSTELAIGFYRSVLSPVRQPASSCQFIPSCSEYARLAVHEHGFVIGSMLAADRYVRCSGGHAPPGLYPRVQRKNYDPPSQARSSQSPDTVAQPGGALVGNSLRTAHAFYTEGDYLLSAYELRRMLHDSGTSDHGQIGLLVALNYYQLGDLRKAREMVERYQGQATAPGAVMDYLIADRSHQDLWNANRVPRLEALPNPLHFQLYSLVKAEEETAADSLARLMGNTFEAHVAKVWDAGSHSPVLAGIFSAILPGTGYFYCGRWQDGLSATVVNGLLGWGIYTLFKNGNTAPGILLSSIAVPFYLGNIVGSANAASLRNERARGAEQLALRRALNLDFYFSTEYLESLWR